MPGIVRVKVEATGTVREAYWISPHAEFSGVFTRPAKLLNLGSAQPDTAATAGATARAVSNSAGASAARALGHVGLVVRVFWHLFPPFAKRMNYSRRIVRHFYQPSIPYRG